MGSPWPRRGIPAYGLDLIFLVGPVLVLILLNTAAADGSIVCFVIAELPMGGSCDVDIEPRAHRSSGLFHLAARLWPLSFRWYVAELPVNRT